MSKDKKTGSEGNTREFEENPFDPEKKKPEDVVRLFYVHDMPILPVVSKRGILIGVLKKEDVISELSDIERAERFKIDEFISHAARKMNFEDLLPYGTIEEFIIINLFGEVQGTWPRIKLFTASEGARQEKVSRQETKKQKEEQVLEWMIYLILEHIPRALYALNKRGNTIFYNSYFEDLYTRVFKNEVDVKLVEKSLSSGDRNEMVSSREGGDLTFYNSDLKIYYEKIPLLSKGKNVGYLVFCTGESEEQGGLLLPGVDIRGLSLPEITDAIERRIIVDALRDETDMSAVARSLKMNRKSLLKKIDKHGIALEK